MRLPVYEPSLASAPDTSTTPLLAKGFRPFFLLAGLLAVSFVPMWLLALFGHAHPGGELGAMTWHGHEMVFGYTTAVIAGFLLTAVSNWTKRPTATGWALGALAAVWLVGRVAVASPGPRWVVAAIDLTFLPLLAVTLARPIVLARNRRNAIFVLLLAALFAANLVTHLDGLGWLPGWRRLAHLVAIDVVLVMIVLIAGRVIPMFTRNATQVQTIRNVRALDVATVAGMLAVTAGDIAMLSLHTMSYVTAAVALVALVRMSTWGTRHALKNPMLWVLHLGYAWVPVGLALRAFSSPAAIHAFTVGAIGLLTVGMMARVSLGHTGRPIVAPRALTAAFVMLAGASILRVGSQLLLVESYLWSLVAVGALWTAAFALFLYVVAPLLSRPRVDGKPG